MDINLLVHSIFEDGKVPYWKTALKGAAIGGGLGSIKGYRDSNTVQNQDGKRLSLSKLKKEDPNAYNSLMSNPKFNKARKVSFGVPAVGGAVGGALGSVITRKIGEIIKKRKQEQTRKK